MNPARRLLPLIGLACVVSFAWIDGSWMLAQLYTREVRASLARGTPASANLPAMQAAVSLAPWDASARLLLARLKFSSGAPAAGIEIESRDALTLAAADPYAWIDRAQLLAAQGRFGAEFETAVTRATTLGPTAPPIQRASAQLGAKYWYRGSPQLQKLWLENMRYELRHEPRRFLYGVVHSNNRYWFCASAALDLPLAQWCSGVWDTDESAAAPPAAAAVRTP